MMKFIRERGQFVLWPLVGTASAVALAAFSYLASDISKINAQVDAHKQEDIQAYQDIATLQEAIATIKENQRQQNADLKEILRILK